LLSLRFLQTFLNFLEHRTISRVYGNGKYPGIPEMADSIYKGIQLFKNDSADLVGKYLQEMFVDTGEN
jgi:hypothetical protein